MNKKLIQQLRRETSMGLMDCYQALVKFDNDYEKAKNWLLSKEFWKFKLR